MSKNVFSPRKVVPEVNVAEKGFVVVGSVTLVSPHSDAGTQSKLPFVIVVVNVSSASSNEAVRTLGVFRLICTGAEGDGVRMRGFWFLYTVHERSAGVAGSFVAELSVNVTVSVCVPTVMAEASKVRLLVVPVELV